MLVSCKEEEEEEEEVFDVSGFPSFFFVYRYSFLCFGVKTQGGERERYLANEEKKVFLSSCNVVSRKGLSSSARHAKGKLDIFSAPSSFSCSLLLIVAVSSIVSRK